MRLGRLPQPTGDLRADALAELRWAMAGAGVTVEKLQVMDAVRRLPVVAAALGGMEPHRVPRAAYDVLAGAVRDLGDGLHARLLRSSLAFDYAGSAKDLTARRYEFVGAHNAAAPAGSRNVLPETTRALYAIEQQLLEALVTALGAPHGGPAEQLPAEVPSPVVRVPRELPAAPARFSGRADALEWLDRHAFGSGTDGAAPTVLAVHGTAGVGKTALALHWAHRVADRFPDGQLHVDLRGHSRGGAPLTPVAALRRLLTALGVAADRLSADEGQLAGAYRSAAAGKRLLVVLDNAATTEQAAPLVPGAPGCVVVVTSRNALPGLTVERDARVLTLDALTPADAAALFDALLGPERIGADPEAGAAVADLCGYLPLALRIVAAKLQAEPDATLAAMAGRLRAADRLTALGFDGDGGLAVRAAFELSYDALADDTRRAFRLLGLVPGADVTDEAVAALLGTDAATADRLLDRLAASHLVTRTARGRYTLHDLLRDYAAELCLAIDVVPDRHAAVERLLAYYTHRASEATVLLNPTSLRVPGGTPDLPAPEPFAGRDAGVEWLAAERANLTAAVVQAAANGHPRAAWQLAYAMRGYFLVGVSGADWMPIGEAGLAAAARGGEDHAVSAMHGLLGRAYRRLGDLPAAQAQVELALATSRIAGWVEGEMIAECTLGGILQDEGRLEEAIVHHGAALDLARRHGDPAGGATHLANIGAALCQIGRFSDASEYFAEVLAITRRRGDERGVAIAHECLGSLNYQFGKLDEAAADVDRALEAFRRLDFRDLEAECLSTYARIRCDLGDTNGAQAYALASLRLARELTDARVEAVALSALGDVALRIGDPAEATERYGAALTIALRIGYVPGQVGAHVGLAAAALAAADAEEALALATGALAEAREGGFLVLEARALTVLGAARLALGDRAGAAEAANQALDIHLACGSRLGADEAEALLAGTG